MFVDFLNVRFTCHHSGLLTSPARFCFFSHQDHPALPSGKPKSATQGGQEAQEPDREVALPQHLGEEGRVSGKASRRRQQRSRGL